MDKPELNKETNSLRLQSTVKRQVAGQTSMLIGTGLSVHIPEGYYGLVTSTNNLTEKYPLFIRPTVITSDDREEIQVSIVNYTSYPEPISEKLVIAQMILMPVMAIDLTPVSKLSKPKEE